MKFYDLMSQVIALLQREGRVSYRALKREFDVADDVLEDLKEELITVKELAVDKDGKMLVWVGNTEEDKEKRRREKGKKGEKEKQETGEREKQDPSRWTPVHLAARIRAEQVAMEARGGIDGETQNDHRAVCRPQRLYRAH